MSDVASASVVLSTAPSFGAQALEYTGALLVTLLSAFASWLMPKVCAWVDARTHGSMLETAGLAAETIVMAIEQDVVKDARQKANDGRITQAEFDEILVNAKKSAVERFTAYAKTLPATLRPMLLGKAESLLEAALGKLKAQGLIASMLTILAPSAVAAAPVAAPVGNAVSASIVIPKLDPQSAPGSR